MNVEIGTEVAQFPEKEYINGILVAVWAGSCAGSHVCLLIRDRELSFDQ